MDRARLKLDLEYITLREELPEDETLRAVLGRLDAVAAEAGLPDQLAHYLAKRSYEKAVTWLKDPNTPHHP